MHTKQEELLTAGQKLIVDEGETDPGTAKKTDLFCVMSYSDVSMLIFCILTAKTEH